MANRKPTRLEVFSAPILLFIHSLPRWIFPVFTAGLLLIGLFATNGIMGGLFLVLVGIVLGWLVALSWPLLTNSTRLMRLGLLLLVFGYAIGRFIGRF
jgi:hypothetical protein